MTTREKIQNLPPLEKIATLVNELDLLRSQVDQQIQQDKSLDDLVDILFLDELSNDFGVSQDTMRKKLEAIGGKVFKLGKRYALRKVNFLSVLEYLETKP